MKRFRSLSLLTATAFLGNWAVAQPVPTPGGEPGPKPVKAKATAGEWEVRFSDDSTMKVALLDEQVVVHTPHGSLTIPARDIRKIEFGVRLNAEDQLKFDGALAAVGDKDSKKREEGKAQLKMLGEKIAPFLKRAIRKADSETAPHLEQIYEAVAGDRAARKEAPQDYDTIITEDSQFAGRIGLSHLRINTFQFGELKLKIADAKVIQFGGWKGGGGNEKYEIVEAGNFYQLFQTHMGLVVGIQVTGANNGAVWGSGPYTGDSTLGTAAVHAGALKVGETKVIKVRIVQDPGNYTSTTANGITSHPFGRYPTGAYEILVK